MTESFHPSENWHPLTKEDIEEIFELWGLVRATHQIENKRTANYLKSEFEKRRPGQELTKEALDEMIKNSL